MCKTVANLRRNLIFAMLSYVFLLLMTPTIKSIFIVFILFSLICVLIFYSLNSYPERISGNYRGCLKELLFSSLFSFMVAYSFYLTWFPSSKIEKLASVLHISSSAFLFGIGCIGFIAGVITITQYIIYVSGNSSESIRKSGCLFLVVLYTYICAQTMVCGTIMSPGLLHVLLNTMVILSIIAVSGIFTANMFISIGIGSLIPLLYATVDNYIYRLRGNEVTLLDFKSAQTALNVVSEYNMSVPVSVVVCWLGWVLMLFIIKQSVKTGNNGQEQFRKQSLIGLVGCIILFWIFVGRLKPYSWNNFGSIKNGTMLNIAIQIKESGVKKPKDYSSQKIAGMEENYGTAVGDADKTVIEEHPAIIVIMDESFTDFEVYGSEVNTDSDLLPFIRSLDRNVIKGYAYSSVYGGNTPNSEFEFLTGNSMGFLPNGAVAYQQYISGHQYSMLDALHKLGYKCSVTHPYYASGWNRPRVYEALGFDETSFIDDYPKKDMVRDYVSDQEMFEYVINDYETRDKSGNYFLFGITMQNHGGYLRKDYENTVRLNYGNDYPKAEQFLSLTQLTDQAVEKLLAYFENEDSPVVICFFGDHQPAIETEFLKELYGNDFSDINREILKYKIPFFIWANYDLETKLDIETSLNYLSTYVFEAAGIDLPPYNRFLKQIEQGIPAINSLGYYSEEQKAFIPIDEAQGKEKDTLAEYQMLEYNNLFDKKNLSLFFDERN